MLRKRYLKRVWKAKSRKGSLAKNYQKKESEDMTDESINFKKTCIVWFEKYCQHDSSGKPDTIGPDGILKFCKDLGVEPKSFIMLAIAWKMGASKIGFFTKEEWLRGLSKLKCDSIAKLRVKINILNKSIMQNSFKNVYEFTYNFAKAKNQRSIDTNTAREMLNILFKEQWELYPQFDRFLEQSKYNVIDIDQWLMILEFSKMVSEKNELFRYNNENAWPGMFNEFIQWMKNSPAVDEAMQTD